MRFTNYKFTNFVWFALGAGTGIVVTGCVLLAHGFHVGQLVSAAGVAAWIPAVIGIKEDKA